MSKHKETNVYNIDFKALSKTCKNEQDIPSLTKVFMKNMLQNMLNSEIEEHIEVHDKNYSRNGYYKKTIKSNSGNLELDIPRDRTSNYKPQIIPKRQTTINEIGNNIISLYAKGMNLSDMELQIKKIYDIDISNSLISRITDKIIPEIEQWQNKTLEAIYPIVYMDTMVFKTKDYKGYHKNKALHLVIGINTDGKKELLGIWLGDNKGAQFWLPVITDLKNRGVEDILYIV